MRELRAPVTPEEARRTWESQRHPTAQSVARALRQAGKSISAKTVARWQVLNWDPIIPPRHPMEVAMDTLDAAIPLLTGDPASSVRNILQMQQDAKTLESLTEAELCKETTRALMRATIVINLAIARRADDLVGKNLREFTFLLGASNQAFKASLLNFSIVETETNDAAAEE
jgi:hypothetical protein